MKNMQKMKRMSINDVREAFSQIGKTEQESYVGMWKYIYNDSGVFLRKESDGKFNTATVIVEGRGGSLEMSEDGMSSIRFGQTVSEYDARPFFDFIQKNSKVEWALVKENGKHKVFTSHLEKDVIYDCNSNTQEITHGHWGESAALPSDNDKTYAANAKAKGYNVKFTVFYNGTYQDYNEYGSYGDTYTYGY